MPTHFSQYSKKHAPTAPEAKAAKVVCLRQLVALSIVLFISAAFSAIFIYKSHGSRGITASHALFAANITSPTFPCVTQAGRASSHAGFIGLEGDTSQTPKRSFFWYGNNIHSSQGA
jgi:hypothetical protein